jgi:hypothetical protein
MALIQIFRILDRGGKWTARLPLTRPEHASSAGWFRVHTGFMAAHALLVGASLLLARPGGDLEHALANGVRPYLLTSVLCLYLAERVLSLAYGRPLRHSALARNRLLRHPLLLLAVVAALHLWALAVPELYYAARFDGTPPAARAAALVALLAHAIPFWLYLLHAPSVWRASRQLRPRAEETNRTPRRWRHVAAIGEGVLAVRHTAGETARLLRQEWARRRPPGECPP